ncbi:MAG: aminotransferase class I/II-fold pyridoxal phosphate-dependent enzyme [Cytophagales bacterium]
MLINSTEQSLADFFEIAENDVLSRASYFQKFIDDITLKKHFNYKRVATDASGSSRQIICNSDGRLRDMIYMASNDYLSLCNHNRLKKASINAILKYGVGASSAPLLGGTTELHVELEEKIAKFKYCESAMLFSSGFGTNYGAIMALLNNKDLAIVDMYAHASIIDGCKNTNLKYFKHNDPQSLEQILARNHSEYRTKMVIIDGVYSMEGDIAKLDEIVEIARRYGALIMLDEAHATGVLGKNGHGTLEHFNLQRKVDIVTGTFSKALGAVGGFVAGSKEIITLLNFYARSYMFSAAISTPTVAAVLEALDIIEEEPEHRIKLWQNIIYFKSGLLSLGFNIGNCETAIFPIIIGNDNITKEICRELHESNIYVNPVLYPAVPKRLSRIRISLMSAHSFEQLDYVLNKLEHLGKKYNII